MTIQNATLPVISRKSEGEVTAVFPTLPWDTAGQDLTIYAHIGQHGGAHMGWYLRTRAAKPAEYADLLAELTRIYGTSHGEGDQVYDLKVAQKMTPRHRDAFREEVRRIARHDRASAARERGESVSLGLIRPLPASVRALVHARPHFS